MMDDKKSKQSVLFLFYFIAMFAIISVLLS